MRAVFNTYHPPQADTLFSSRAGLQEHTDAPAASGLLRSELEQLGVQVEPIEHLPVLREFREIAERELFSRPLAVSRCTKR